MTLVGWLQIALFAVIITLLTRPLGGYLAWVYAGERTLRPLETALYRIGGISQKPNRPHTNIQSRYSFSTLLVALSGSPIVVCVTAVRLSEDHIRNFHS
jgi:potassium-transporting ATPase potassium-binding subunit